MVCKYFYKGRLSECNNLIKYIKFELRNSEFLPRRVQQKTYNVIYYILLTQLLGGVLLPF